MFAWCLYDWAYSAFNTVVSTFVIATYFVQAVAVDPATGTAQWAAVQAIAGIIIALCAAPLGAIADCGGGRRIMLAACTLVMIAATSGLWFARPVHTDAALVLGLVGLATIGFELATVFYNAMLVEVAAPERVGRVSGLAWGSGYVGGLVCLAVCLFLLVDPKPPPFGLNAAAAENVRATALFAGAWIALFSWPAVVLIPDEAARQPWGSALRDGMARLRLTLTQAVRDPVLGRFFIARMIYTDGLTTLFAFGAIYAAGHFGMGTHDVLLLGIGLNVTAGLGALGFALIEDRIGSRATVLISLSALTVLSVGILMIDNRSLFWAMSLSLGIFVGPAQAASRSLMARIAPPEERTAHFGLYALSGRVTGFLGPAALAAVTAAAGSQRAGMAVITVLLATGAVLLARIRFAPAEVPVTSP